MKIRFESDMKFLLIPVIKANTSVTQKVCLEFIMLHQKN